MAEFVKDKDVLISRQAAINALSRGSGCGNSCRRALERIPAAEPKRGKWNVYYHGDNDFSYSCNQCGYGAPFDKMAGKVYQRKWRYCPNCGAKMEDSDE